MDYVYRPKVKPLAFADAMERLTRQGFRVVPHGIDNASPARVDEILRLARAQGMAFQPCVIDIADYRHWLQEAGYGTRYRDYYPDNRTEKSLEHYVAFKLLRVGAEDVFVDLAAEHSPVHEIYGRFSHAQAYSQDIMYPPRIDGHRIGGDACAMPVSDAFFSRALLSCSLEHFEQDADARLFQELARVLKPGGAVCVVPFYLYDEAATQTDPCVSVPAQVPFDAGAPLYCAEHWGNRHGRFYSPQSFQARIADRVPGAFRFDFYHLVNAAAVDPSVYARFAFTATRQ